MFGVWYKSEESHAQFCHFLQFEFNSAAFAKDKKRMCNIYVLNDDITDTQFQFESSRLHSHIFV